jgi:hypothetical protein
MTGWNCPPGVTGTEPEIAGYPDEPEEEEAGPAELLERDLGELLGSFVYCNAEDRAEINAPEAAFLEKAKVRSFEDAMLLTSDRGLVLRLANGNEFQITIVQSR